QSGHQSRREQPASGALRSLTGTVYLDTLHAAAWRILLEYVAAEIVAGQLLGPACRPPVHPIGVIDARAGREHAKCAADSLEPERLAGCTESQFDFGADTNPFDELPERFRQEAIALVAAVEPDFIAEQTCRYSNPDRRPVFGRHRLVHGLTAVLMISTSPSGAKSPEATVAR